MLDRDQNGGNWFEAVPPAPLPVARLLIGKKVADAAALLPRLFSLCRAANGLALRMALGLGGEDREAALAEIRDEHALRLGVFLPRAFGLAPLPVAGLSTVQLSEALFGAGRFPDQALDDFLRAGMGIAPLLVSIRDAFAPGEACVSLPIPAGKLSGAEENSAAVRHLTHPFLQEIETRHGRGPLWRVAGRALDLQAVLDGVLPEPRRIGRSGVLVPVARGTMYLEASATDGRVTSFRRITPTDSLLADGGILQKSLAGLGERDRALQLLDILDPCVPVQLREVANA